MAQIETWFNQELKQPVKVRYLDGNIFSADNAGNLVGVNVFDDGEPASLSGSVSANVIRADGNTVAVTGTLSGNQASIVLPQAAYAIPGVISIVIKLTSGTDITTLCAVVANVYMSTTDNVVDPGTIIPSVETLIAAINAAVAGIPADYSNLLAAIASDYSSSKTYPIVGAYAWYNGVLKRSIVPITTAESYNAAHWTNAIIGDDVSALKSTINQEGTALCSYADNGYYKIPSAFIEQGHISNTTGKKSDDAKKIRLGQMIPVKAGAKIYFTPGTVCTHIAIRYYALDQVTLTRTSGFTTQTDMPDIEQDGYFAFVMRSGDGSGNITPSQYDAKVEIYTALNASLDKPMQNRGTLTENDDLNSITKPGVYFFGASSIPANAPNNVSNGRVMVVKSDTGNNHSQEWQIIIDPNGTYVRSYNSSSSDFTDWITIATKEDVESLDEKSFTVNGTITSTDDLNVLSKSGSYFFGATSVPGNVPQNVKNGRVLVVKSTTKNNHSREWQMIGATNGFFARAYGSAFTEWDKFATERNIYYNGFPILQTETLPYNAVTYHAKWDSLLQSNVLRRVNLGNVQDDSSLPMYAYEFSPQRNYFGSDGPVAYNWENKQYLRPKALIIGGVHGNEKCTPMDIYTIVKLMKENKELNEIACKFDWYIIPLVNPWGYSHAKLDSNGDIVYTNTATNIAQIVECTAEINAGIRTNCNTTLSDGVVTGQDINRDWSDVVFTASTGQICGFQTPELQMIKDYVIGIKPDLFMDIHQNHAAVSTSATNFVNSYCIINAKDDSSADYQKVLREILRHIDIANADADRIMKVYTGHTDNEYQTCVLGSIRTGVNVGTTNGIRYFSGIPVSVGGTLVGNIDHQDIATPYSICTETSEICAPYSGTTEWYTPIPCTFSATYFFNMLKQMAKLF